MNDEGVIDLLEQAYHWTGERIGVVQEADLDNATPCGAWTLRQLLDHVFGAGRVLSALAADELDSDFGAVQSFVTGLITACRTTGDLGAAFGETAAAPSLAVWRTPGMLDRDVTIMVGTLPAPQVLRLNLLEVLMHGWDISQATGEAAELPEEPAAALLEIARHFVRDPRVAPAFGPRVPNPDATSDADTAVALLGRTPLAG